MRKSALSYIDTVIEFVKEATEGKPCIFFDLETTGLNHNLDRILSCSAVKVMFQNGTFEIVDTLDFFMNPGFPIPYVVTKINGITDDMVHNSPDEETGYETIHKFFGDNPVIAGYNSTRFDQKFMESMYLRAAGEEFSPKIHLDVLTMAKEKLDLPSYKLQAVTEDLGCSRDLSFHRSIDDVKATFRVFIALLGMYMIENDESECVRVKNVRYWAPRHTLARVYVTTQPETKTYYDIYQNAWFSDKEGVNITDIREQAFRLTNVNNEKDFVKFAKYKNKGDVPDAV